MVEIEHDVKGGVGKRENRGTGRVGVGLFGRRGQGGREGRETSMQMKPVITR